MRRGLGSLAGVCALLALAAPSAIAASIHCRGSDYAMQCLYAAPGADGSQINARQISLIARQARVYAFGIDFAWRSVSAHRARQLGARFAASYLSTHQSKNWTRASLRNYHAAGLGTVCVWETTATRALSGYAGGRSDASAALQEEQALGVPASKPVYFAVDFNETSRQAVAVASYFRGVDSVLGMTRTGGYGSYYAVRRLFNAGLVRFGWQTSTWSDGRWDRRAQLQQYAYQGSYDWDRAMTTSIGATH